jgi:hypothetical protein
MKNASGDLCGFVNEAGFCTDRACTNAPTPSSDANCSGYLTACTISNTSTPICILKTSVCS